MDEARRSNSKVKQWIRRTQNAPQELPSHSALESIVPKGNMHSIRDEKKERKEAQMKNSLRDVKLKQQMPAQDSGRNATRQRSHSDGNIYHSTPYSATPHDGNPAVFERVGPVPRAVPKAMPVLPRSNTWGAADSAMSPTAPKTPRPLPSFSSEPAADASPTEHAPTEMSNILPDIIRTLRGLFGSDTPDDTYNTPRTTTFPRSQHSIDLDVSEHRLLT